MNYLVATINSWNIGVYKHHTSKLNGNWFLVNNNKDLTLEYIRKINPRYIFFPHWSWVVPKDITDNYECVCFHMTDLPYGRGGSPLQNLIIRGHKETQITALRMTQELDAGDIYQKVSLDLSGSAQEIFTKAAGKIYLMISEIVQGSLVPVPQIGEVTLFERRILEQSEIPGDLDLENVYDYIRMLDADSYPKAYINYGNFRLLFNTAILKDGKLTACVEIEEVVRE